MQKPFKELIKIQNDFHSQNLSRIIISDISATVPVMTSLIPNASEVRARFSETVETQSAYFSWYDRAIEVLRSWLLEHTKSKSSKRAKSSLSDPFDLVAI